MPQTTRKQIIDVLIREFGTQELHSHLELIADEIDQLLSWRTFSADCKPEVDTYFALRLSDEDGNDDPVGCGILDKGKDHFYIHGEVYGIKDCILCGYQFFIIPTGIKQEK